MAWRNEKKETVKDNNFVLKKLTLFVKFDLGAIPKPEVSHIVHVSMQLQKHASQTISMSIIKWTLSGQDIKTLIIENFLHPP